MASFGDDATLTAVWRALRGTNVDETKLRLQLAGSLAGAQRLTAALTIYDGLLESEGGDAELALRVFAIALVAGDEARAERWAKKALGEIARDAPAVVRLMFADKAAQMGAEELAQALSADEQAESWRKAQVNARVALARGTSADIEAFRAAIEQRLLLSPDEAVARVESARLVLTTRAGNARDGVARAWSDEALRIVEPLVRDEEAPALALELAFAASRDAASARPLLDRLSKRFPGGLKEPALVLQAALAFEDAAIVGRVLQTLAPEARRELLLQLAQARQVAGEGPLPTAIVEVLELELARADADRCDGGGARGRARASGRQWRRGAQGGGVRSGARALVERARAGAGADAGRRAQGWRARGADRARGDGAAGRARALRRGAALHGAADELACLGGPGRGPGAARRA